MNKKFPAYLYHFLLLIWFGFIFAVGIWNYKKGFLLTRNTVNNISNCEDFKVEFFDKPWLKLPVFNSTSTKKQCWLPAKFEKAVILLIDGLRFDFAYAPKSIQNSDKLYRYRMNIFNEIVLRFPKNSFLAPFVADPPTTTLQRLQGLTTGSLPTFIDASSNFQGESLTEDSLVEQAFLVGKKIVFLGDDTWDQLFPKKFHRSFFYPSFNVKDLHTVDNGILDHLYEEMDKKDWDIIVAHFLGVDHCGHRYGPDHPEMASKLRQMNAIVRNVTRTLPENTILFVLGDHGMTSTGDHGGDSQPEITTTLFAYSRKTLLGSFNQFKNLNPVPQVNFVPTLSLLLGFPIPFSSLGTVLLELFALETKENKDSAQNVFRDDMFSTLAVMANAFQVHRYLQTLPWLEVKSLEETWVQAQNILDKIEVATDTETIITDLMILRESYLNYLNSARQLCSDKWAKFDIMPMCLGCGIVIIAVTILAVLVYRVCCSELNIARIGTCLLKSAFFVLPISFLPWCVGYTFSGSLTLDVCSSVAFLTQAAMCLILVSNRTIVERTEEQNSHFGIGDSETFFCVLCLGLHFCSFFSNSFVVQEDQLSIFFAQTLFVVFIISKLVYLANSKAKVSKLFPRFSSLFDFHFLVSLPFFSVLLLGLLRIGQLFHKCREEHGPSCQNYLLIIALRSIPEHWSTYKNTRLFLVLLLLSAMIVLFLYLMKLGWKYFSYDLTALFVNYAVPFVSICISANWILSLAPKKTLDKLLTKKEEVPAQTAAILCCIIVAVIGILPVTISHNSSTTHPRWFCFHMTFVVNQGLSLAGVVLLSFLLLGDGLSFALMSSIVITAIWFYLGATFINRNKSHNLWLFNFGCILSNLSSHGFFSTGHQAVFSAIHWNSPFVISSGESIGHVLPALVIIFETFCVQVLLIMFMHGVVSLLELCSTIEGSVRSLLKENLISSHVRGILPSLSKKSNNPNVGYLSHFENSLLVLQLSFLLCQAVKLSGAIISSFILRRHLMVWKIFAPRLVFEVVSFGVTIVVMLLSQLMTIRLMIKLDSS